MVLNEWGDEWVIKIYEGDEPPPLGLCAGGQHAQESWPECRKCYSHLGEKYTYRRELRDLRGQKRMICARYVLTYSQITLKLSV